MIELLVVIAIIGILATVVIASLNGARDKAKSAAIKSEARQLFNLAMEHYAETGDFSTFVSTNNWIKGDAQSGASAYGCSSRIINTAINRDKAIEICNSITSKLPTNTSGDNANNKLILHCNSSFCNPVNEFSIVVKLQDNEYQSGASAGKYLCMGTSGSIAETFYSTALMQSTKGCSRNP